MDIVLILYEHVRSLWSRLGSERSWFPWEAAEKKVLGTDSLTVAAQFGSRFLVQIHNACAGDAERVALLHKDHGAQVFALPFGRQAECGYQLAAVRSLWLYSSNDAKAADHRGMPQGPAAVLSTRHQR